MYPFKKILFPVDFSKRCEAIAPAVRALAARNAAQVTLFHALDMPPGGYAEWYSFAAMVDIRAIEDHTVRSLDRFAHRLFEGFPVEKVVMQGRPADAIADHLRENPTDLIMIASHGHGRFRSLMLGSVTSAILHDFAVPVWTAAHAFEDPPKNGDYKNIVCAIDMEADSEDVLKLAKQIVQDYRAKLTVVHSEPAVEDMVHSDSAERFRRFLEFRAREDYAPLASAAGVDAPIVVVEGAVGESIAAAAKKYQADLLIIGRGCVRGTLGRLRTHANDIIRRSPCPVLSV